LQNDSLGPLGFEGAQHPRKSVGLTQDNRSAHTFSWISGVLTTRSRPSDVSIAQVCGHVRKISVLRKPGNLIQPRSRQLMNLKKPRNSRLASTGHSAHQSCVDRQTLRPSKPLCGDKFALGAVGVKRPRPVSSSEKNRGRDKILIVTRVTIKMFFWMTRMMTGGTSSRTWEAC
jgi:hypothetical protein